MFDCLENRVVQVENQYSTDGILFVNKEPEIKFNLEQVNINEYKITTNAVVYDFLVFLGRRYDFVLIGNQLYRCSKKYRNTVIKLLDIFRKNFTKESILPTKELSNFFVIVEPNIKNSLEVPEKEYQKIKKYIPPQLYAKLYLDYNEKNYVVAEVRFIYDDVEINPLDGKNYPEVVSRNSIKEAKLLNMLVESGFMLDQKNNRLLLIYVV